MNVTNQMKLSFISKSANESFARAVVSAFLLPTDPTVSDIADIKTAVSEAVTNCIVHAYPHTDGTIYIDMKIVDNKRVIIKVRTKVLESATSKRRWNRFILPLRMSARGWALLLCRAFATK